MNKLNRLTDRIGYTFSNPKHLEMALTHRSASSRHNERLEFLGDSILNAVISTALYHRFPHQNEGQLSRLRAHLVKGDTLAEIASSLNLGDFLHLGPGELKTGGFRRSSILADALEAIFAAIFLDRGFEASQNVILALYQTRLDSNLDTLNTKDPKTELQEYLQACKKPLPQYTLIQSIENESETRFEVTCTIKETAKNTSLDLETTGVGQTRRKAEQEAALALLQLLKKLDDRTQ